MAGAGGGLNSRTRLVLLSFLLLFLELVLIRWTGGHIFYLSYFSNFVLLGSFLGIGVLLQHAVDIPVERWRRVMEVNLTGAFITAKAFARRMIDQGTGGRVIFTSSLFGLRGGVENGAYSASKFGMIGLAQSMAAELASHGILVNAVCPGQIDTEMMAQLSRDRAALTGRSPEDVIGALNARIPLGRLGTLDELADVYVFLASDLSRYVTGQSLVVDGGWQVG